MIAIFGARGMGKTFLLRQLINQYPRVFLFDPAGDPKFNNWAPVTRTFQDATAAAREKRFRIRFVQDERFTLEAVCEAAFLHLKNCLIAIDEIQEFIPNDHFGIRKVPWFRKCVLRGRHEGISLIGSSQRPVNVHNDFISQAEKTYLFRSEVEDLGWLKRYKVLHGAPFLTVGKFLTWPDQGERQ